MAKKNKKTASNPVAAPRAKAPFANTRPPGSPIRDPQVGKRPNGPFSKMLPPGRVVKAPPQPEEEAVTGDGLDDEPALDRKSSLKDS